MKNHSSGDLVRTAILFCIAGLITACGDNSSEVASQPPGDPPEFTISSGADLRSGMSQLGFQLALLERELVATEYNQIGQGEVVAILQEMELIGSSLQATDAGEVHQFLQDDMPVFVDTVREARLAASDTPPRYYPAGRVAGGCVNCHEVNR